MVFPETEHLQLGISTRLAVTPHPGSDVIMEDVPGFDVAGTSDGMGISY